MTELKANAPHDSFRNKLIEITCAMIDNSGGSGGINMRSLAREAGCAHTNIYNYFSSFHELLYVAMLRTMEKLVLFTQEQVGGRPNSAEDFPKFIQAQIDFARKHSGLYRFMWLETLTGDVPENIKEFARVLKNRFAELVYISAGGKLTHDEALEASMILHGYLHGDICKMISGRDMDMKTDAFRDIIMKNVERLLKMLTEKHF